LLLLRRRLLGLLLLGWLLLGWLRLGLRLGLRLLGLLLGLLRRGLPRRRRRQRADDCGVRRRRLPAPLRQRERLLLGRRLGRRLRGCGCCCRRPAEKGGQRQQPERGVVPHHQPRPMPSAA
jgi:hypothetical protein